MKVAFKSRLHILSQAGILRILIYCAEAGNTRMKKSLNSTMLLIGQILHNNKL